MHRLTDASPTNGDGNRASIATAVAGVMSDVEEYLVTNLMELERAGANGNGLLPIAMLQFAVENSPPTCPAVFPFVCSRVLETCSSMRSAVYDTMTHVTS